MRSQRVDAHQLAQLEEVGDAAGLFQALVQVVAAARHVHVLPELVAQLANLPDRVFEAGGVARHAAVVPHDFAQLAMERVHRPLALDRKQLADGLVARTRRRCATSGCDSSTLPSLLVAR